MQLPLYLRDFYNIIFKIKHKLYMALWSGPPPPQEKIPGAQLLYCVCSAFIDCKCRARNSSKEYLNWHKNTIWILKEVCDIFQELCPE
jgi:hypothetical protein